MRGKWRKKKWRPVISSSMLLPSSVGVSVGEGVGESVRLGVWGTVWPLFGWKFPGVTGWNGVFFYQTKSWKVSGANFCWSDVRFRDSPSQKWIERAEAEVKILSWATFPWFWGEGQLRKNLLFLYIHEFARTLGFKGPSLLDVMWLKKTCSWLKPKSWGCNAHVFMSTTWRAATVLNYCNIYIYIYIYIPHKGLETPKVCCFQDFQNLSFPPKNARKFQEDSYAQSSD